jgi:hypothetical protein
MRPSLIAAARWLAWNIGVVCLVVIAGFVIAWVMK